jgi:hypothetical protein
MATSGQGRVEHESFMRSVHVKRIETGQARPSYTSQFGQHFPDEQFSFIHETEISSTMLFTDGGTIWSGSPKPHLDDTLSFVLWKGFYCYTNPSGQLRQTASRSSMTTHHAVYKS